MRLFLIAAFAAVVGIPTAGASPIRPVWRGITSATGEMFKIDTGDLEPLQSGAVAAFVIVGDLSPPRHLFFDCRGHFSDFDDPEDVFDAPPRSVVGELAQIACAGRPRAAGPRAYVPGQNAF